MGIQKISTISADGSGDWKTGMLSLWNAIKTQGGTIDFDGQQEIVLKSSLNYGTLNPNLKIKGDGSNRVKIMTPGAAAAWIFGTIAVLTLEDFMFTGEGTEGSGAPTDAQDVVIISSVLKAILNRVHFVGLKGGKMLTMGSQLDFHIMDSIFSGNAGTSAIHIAGAYRGVIENCHFLDYFYCSPNSYSKTPDGIQTWIKAVSPPAGVVGANQHHLTFRNLVLDEGANTAIEVDGYDDLIFEHCKDNIKGIGYKLNDVKRAEFRGCGVGYNNVDYPMIKATNCRDLTIIGQHLDDNELAHPYRIEVDSVTAAGLKLLQSPDVIVSVV